MPWPEHEALAIARAREGAAEGKRLYEQRQGVESTLSLNLDRIAAWFVGRPLAPTCTSRFAALAA